MISPTLKADYINPLRPCPFCGSEAKTKLKYNKRTGKTIVSVRCDSCGAESAGWVMKNADQVAMYLQLATNTVIERWNRRTYEAADTPQEASVGN